MASNILIGEGVPDFTLHCNEGLVHKLSDFRGSKVLLCFYRYANCPVCATSINKIVGSYKKLAWAAKLKVVTVFFGANTEKLNDGITSTIMKMGNCTGLECYPFLALADPKGESYETFQVKNLSFPKFVAGNSLRTLSLLRKYVKDPDDHRTIGVLLNAISSTKREKAFATGAITVLPSEILIDEEGIMVDRMDAKKVGDTMSMERIAHFLLHGTKLKVQHPQTVPKRQLLFRKSTSNEEGNDKPKKMSK